MWARSPTPSGAHYKENVMSPENTVKPAVVFVHGL